MAINILAVGDIVGKTGLNFLQKNLRRIKKEYDIGFTVVNGENTSMNGITPDEAEDIFSAGADVITLGNHTFGRQGIGDYLDDSRYILRPANYSLNAPGRGFGVFDSPVGEICVINLIGRCDMAFGPDSPFLEVDRILKKNDAKIKLVDFHAEATSEKLAMAYHLDGRVSCLWGTHTHVQTSDSEIFPNGMGYITDLGMTGAARSVLGVDPEISKRVFLGFPPERYQDAGGIGKLEGTVFTVDEKTGKCISLQAIRRK